MTGKWSLVSVVSVAGSREIRNLSYHVQQGGSGTDGISAQVLRASGLTYQYGFYRCKPRDQSSSVFIKAFFNLLPGSFLK